MYFEDLVLHTVYDLEPVIMEKEKMVEFGRMYDPLPVHTDEEYAKTTHFGQLIAPGVMTFMMVWSKFLELGVLGNELIAGQSTSMNWHKPVYAGDTLFGKAEITGLTKRNAKNGMVEVTVRICNQHGELVLTDVTEAVVKCGR